MAENGNSFVIKTVFWTLIIAGFAFTAGSYAFTYGSGIKLAEAVVCNDRLRQQKDDSIAENVEVKLDVVNKDVSRKLDKMQQDISDIKVSIARLAK